MEKIQEEIPGENPRENFLVKIQQISEGIPGSKRRMKSLKKSAEDFLNEIAGEIYIGNPYKNSKRKYPGNSWEESPEEFLKNVFGRVSEQNPGGIGGLYLEKFSGELLDEIPAKIPDANPKKNSWKKIWVAGNFRMNF